MNSARHSIEMSTKLFRGASLGSCFIALLLLAFAAMPAHAQVQNGVFSGTVTDPQGAAVAAADVTITNTGTSSTITVKTNNEGAFRVPELLVGNYSFTVTAAGFKKSVKTGVYLNAGAIETVNFKLELGQQTETVVVEAGIVQVQTEDSRLTTTIGAAQISNLPLNGRNVFDLMQMAPGAVNATGVSMENGHGTVVNGMRPNFSGFLINGSSDKGLSGGVITTPNADIVQEFQELTLNMSAQYGDSAAAIVNVVTKSGTNTFHGSVYEFFRNSALDANAFFRNAGNNGSKDPGENPALKPAKLNFNQFGGTLTGPIWKDHIFFTASYQGDRFVTQANPIPINSESPEWRNAIVAFNAGNPSSAAATVYQNFPTKSPGVPFQNLSEYVASASSGSGFSTFAQYLCPDNYPTGFKQLPAQFASMFGVLPNGAGAGQDDFSTANIQGANPAPCSVTPGVRAGSISRTIPFLNSNVLLFGSQTSGNLFNGNEWSTRIDWNASKNDRVFGEYYWLHSNDAFGAANASSGIHGFSNPTVAHLPNFQANWVHTFSPNWFNEATAGYALNYGNVTVSTPGVPSVAFDDGSAGFGSYNGYPQYFHENIYSYGDMMTFIKGKHSIKTGVNFKRNLENSQFNIARPSYYFFDQLFFSVDAPYGGAAGTDPGFLSNSPAQLADNFRHWRNLDVGAFVQDDWKVRHNLTINVGLRYDLYSRHVEKQGKTTTFLPGPGCNIPANGYCADWILNANVAPNTPLDPSNPAAGTTCNTGFQITHVVLAGVCGPGGFAVAKSLGAGDHNNFGPRVGFAWDPFSKGKTSIRGGFGVSYEGTLYNPQSNSRWNPPFFSFNNFGNALGGGSSVAVYGPTATVNCDGTTVTPSCPLGTPAGVVANCNYTTTACTPSGAAVTFTGSGSNPGQGTGVQATGNIQGYGASNPNLAVLTGVIFPQGIRDPYVLNYYFGVQHEILPKTVLEVNFVGTQGHELFRAEQGNRIVGERLKKGQQVVIQDGTTVTGLGRRRLNPNYGRIRIWDNVSKSWYNSLQVSVKHQATKGLMFNFAYTWSHSIDTGSDWHSGATSANGAAAGDGYSLDVQRPFLDRGNSTFDIRQRLTFNYVWDIPGHADQKGFIGHLLGGWQYQAIWVWQTGAHFTPYCPAANRCDFNYDGERNDRPDALHGNNINVTHNMWANGWFNGTGMTAWCGGGPGSCNAATSFFQTPCLSCDGNVGRNTFTGPGIFNTDQSIFKNFRLTERYKLQFRTEMFNAFNHTNFQLPSSATGGNNANQITNGSFGKSAGTFDPRLIQFALKLLF
jgi:hypothetical protein